MYHCTCVCVYLCTSVPMYQCTRILVYRCTDVPLYWGACVLVYRCNCVPVGVSYSFRGCVLFVSWVCPVGFVGGPIRFMGGGGPIRFVRVYACTGVPVYRCTNVRVYLCTGIPVCVYLCTGVPMYLCLCVPVCRCTGAIVNRWGCPFRFVRVSYSFRGGVLFVSWGVLFVS